MRSIRIPARPGADRSMPNDTASPAPRAPLLRFTLGGMMVFTLGVAVGAAVWRAPRATWHDGVMAALAMWMMLGLANQSRDLRQCLRGLEPLSTADRFGWHYSIGWRVLLIGGMAANLVYRLIAPEDHGAKWYWGLLDQQGMGDRPRELLATVLLIATLASVPAAQVRRNGKRWFDVPVLGALAFAAWAICLAWDAGCIPFLVHLATWGVRIASHSHAFDDTFIRWRSDFVFWSLRAAPLALLNLALVRHVARTWLPISWRWRASTGVTVGGLAAISWYVVWTGLIALPRFDPDAREAMFTYSRLYVMLAGALVGIVVTVATYDWTVPRDETSVNACCRWSLRPAAYYHERVSLTAIVMLATVCHHWESSYYLLTKFWTTSIWLDVFGPVLQTDRPELLALEILTARILINGWLRRPAPTHYDPAPLQPVRFTACWLMTLVAFAGLAAALAGFGVAVWMRP